MTRYNKALSEEQKVDLQWAIMRATDNIGTYLTINQLQPASAQVDHLETLLWAFIDNQYNEDIKQINTELKPTKQNSDMARKAASKTLTYERIKRKHRALMSLAMRCGFMPLKKTGSGGMKDVHN